MGIINADFDKDYEDRPVEEGRYEVRISGYKEKVSRNDEPQVMVMLEVIGEPEAATIFHYLTFPGKKTDDDKAAVFMRMNKRFIAAFDIDTSEGFNPEDLPGLTAECDIKQDGYEGQVKNVLQLPRA